MGFGAPKIPKADNSALLQQNDALQSALSESRKRADALSMIRQPKPYKQAPPSQQTAVDVAAAERMARQSMAKKKGIGWTQNPGSLGGAAAL